MRLTSLIKAACITLGVGLGGTASADIVLSESNTVTPSINSRLTEILSRERAALLRLSTARLERLAGLSQPGSFERAPPKPVKYSREWIDAMPVAKGGPQWTCLSEALYFEARGESVQGQFAVAEVIMNRVDSTVFPDSVCRVIRQGTGRRYQCQFTYTCDGHDEVIREKAAFIRVAKIARLMLDGAERSLTSGATHYHTVRVNPRWAKTFPRTATIGVHHFYRMPGRISASSKSIPTQD